MIGFVKEFKEFAVKGNVVDLAVGFILGAAFNSVVKSLVDDIIMPPIGYMLAGIDFTSLKFSFGEGERVASVNYGMFINNVISFALTAFAVFLLVKVINRLKRKEKNDPKTEDVPGVTTCSFCITEISVKATRCPNCTSELSAAT